MAFFNQSSPALLEILNKIARSEKPMDADHELHEFGLVRYHVQASSLCPQIVYLSIYMPSLFPGGIHFTQLPEAALQFVKTTYGELAEIVEPPRTGFILTLKINFSNISNGKGALNKSVSDLSSLKAVLMISQLKDIFWNIGIYDEIHKPVKLVHHSQEPFFVIRQREKAVTIFPMRFKEDSDVAFATSLFQEFMDARHCKAPNCSWSPIPPPELLGEAFQHLNTNGGFVSFEILPNHVKGARADRVIWTLLNFDAYVKYHIKSTKGFIQRKMRRRMDTLVEVAENARIGKTEVIKKPKGLKRFKKLKSYTKPSVLKQKCKALISNQIKRLHLRIRIKKLIQIRPRWFKNMSFSNSFKNYRKLE